jgi:tRNA 5-methylaminomethyl-2-thiouridine biosynthesis bifunctional protein
MVLKSKQYDDVYFSAQDGLAETRHVFLDGNDLPAAWAGRDDFVIAETGFGTGLNFLAAWALFEETKRPGQKLHFISVEKYPLSGSVIAAELARWAAELQPFLNQFLSTYGEGIQKTQQFAFGDDISLTLLIGDANSAFQEIHIPVDCWFLDGFKPSSNPDMWTPEVFAQIARLARDGGSFATFTAAGFVRRGLMEVGFDVRKVPGFGSKREMLVGVKAVQTWEETCA